VLRADKVAFAYGDAEPVLSEITFSANAGDVLAIVGRNGAGKSTLLRLLNGLLQPHSGAVTVDGCDTATTPVHLLAHHIGTVFQAPEQQIFNATVREEIAFGPRRLGLHGAALETRVAEALDLAGLRADAGRHPLDLDQAALRFVALASVLAMRPPVLLLDEPQRGLGAGALARLDAIIAQQAAGGTCVLMVCHDMDFVAHRASRVLAIAGGRVVADQPARAFFTDPELTRAAGVEIPDTIALSLELGLPPALDPAALAATWIATAG
jgi:energy-coupling factor transport system ATP-binding protein